MTRKTVRYSKGDIGKLRVVKDFLPSPEELVPREDSVKVTLALSRRSVDFFKRRRVHDPEKLQTFRIRSCTNKSARRVPYQRMIRALVDTYAERQEGGKAR